MTFSIGRLLPGTLDPGYLLAHLNNLSTEVIVRQPIKYLFFLCNDHSKKILTKTPAEEFYKREEKNPCLRFLVRSYPGQPSICGITAGGYLAPKGAKASAVSVCGRTPPFRIFVAKIHLNGTWHITWLKDLPSIGPSEGLS